MNRLSLIAAASGLVLAACASAPETVSQDAGANAPLSLNSSPSAFDLAMGTVDSLTAEGNRQVAIDRLTQLLGDQSLTREEMAEALLRRGELRLNSGGFDVLGAVEDFDEIATEYTDTSAHNFALPLLDTARSSANFLNEALASPETTNLEKFDMLMQLGAHRDAMDIMQANNFTPENGTLLAMYQIGYLCDDEGLTGRSYNATDTDGTALNLHFCDLGK